MDPSRPTTANSIGPDGLFAVVDVQGMSHRNVSTFAALHAERPEQPLVLSECCSCSTQRLPREPVDDACMASENAPMALPYVAGSLGVWTLMDYFGEPPGNWPFVSSSFGQLDLAGLPKPHAYWYACGWREGVAPGDPSRVPLPPAPVARVTSLLDQLTYAGTGPHRVTTINGITSAATAELVVDGKLVGHPMPSDGTSVAWAINVTLPPEPAGADNATSCSWPTSVDGLVCSGLTHTPSGSASASACEAAGCDAGADVWQWGKTLGCWVGTPVQQPCAPNPPGEKPRVGGARVVPPVITVRNATLVARDATGAVVATHTVLAPSLPEGAGGSPAALALTLDAPSLATGTGSRLLLDGEDAALVRVASVDALGVLVSTFPVNVTFAIVSGPGRLVGVGSGNPAAHEQPNGAVVATFGGLARAVVQVSVDCVSPHRDLVIAVDTDGGGRTAVLPPGAPCPTAEDIVLSATAPGLGSVQVRIAVSGDASADSPLAAAVASAGSAAVRYLEDFMG